MSLWIDLTLTLLPLKTSSYVGIYVKLLNYISTFALNLLDFCSFLKLPLTELIVIYFCSAVNKLLLTIGLRPECLTMESVGKDATLVVAF